MQEPKTIEELKQWYVVHNLPDETITRFFIGKNYQEPKAFGIYQELVTGDFVVYKNKADETRAVRYQGISWYQYEDYEGWYKVSPPKELKKKHKLYYISSDYSSTYYHSNYKQYPYSIDRFEDSRYYREPSSSSSSSDDYSWSSSDSWDSSSTDWDSDW